MLTISHRESRKTNQTLWMTPLQHVAIKRLAHLPPPHTGWVYQQQQHPTQAHTSSACPPGLPLSVHWIANDTREKKNTSDKGYECLYQTIISGRSKAFRQLALLWQQWSPQLVQHSIRSAAMQSQVQVLANQRATQPITQLEGKQRAFNPHRDTLSFVHFVLEAWLGRVFESDKLALSENESLSEAAASVQVTFRKNWRKIAGQWWYEQGHLQEYKY